MKNKYLTLSILLLTYCFANSKENFQITEDSPRYFISVTHGGIPIGGIEIELFPDIAPKHCRNFDSLVAIKFYDRTAFHRVIPEFMIQGGDPNSRDKSKDTWGYGDPSQTKVPAEFSSISHLRGIISMARRGDDINSANSQFFIMVADIPYLDGLYTVFGKVLEGMDVVDKIVNTPRDSRDNPLQKVEMTIVKLYTNGFEENLKDYNIQIYPNPASEFINIDLPDVIINPNIDIFDVLGRKLNLETTMESNRIRINTSELKTGLYWLSLKLGADYKAMKFIIDK